MTASKKDWQAGETWLVKKGTGYGSQKKRRDNKQARTILTIQKTRSLLRPPYHIDPADALRGCRVGDIKTHRLPRSLVLGGVNDSIHHSQKGRERRNRPILRPQGHDHPSDALGVKRMKTHRWVVWPQTIKHIEFPLVVCKHCNCIRKSTLQGPRYLHRRRPGGPTKMWWKEEPECLERDVDGTKFNPYPAGKKVLTRRSK